MLIFNLDDGVDLIILSRENKVNEILNSFAFLCMLSVSVIVIAFAFVKLCELHQEISNQFLRCYDMSRDITCFNFQSDKLRCPRSYS